MLKYDTWLLASSSSLQRPMDEAQPILQASSRQAPPSIAVFYSTHTFLVTCLTAQVSSSILRRGLGTALCIIRNESDDPDRFNVLAYAGLYTLRPFASDCKILQLAHTDVTEKTC